MTRYGILISIFITQMVSAQITLDFVFKTNELQGGVVVQNTTGSFVAYNSELELRKETPPAATYLPIAYLLIAENFPTYMYQQQLEWDGIHRTFFGQKRPEWEKSSTLVEAFINQNDYFFQYFLEKIPQNQLDTIHKKVGYSSISELFHLPYYWQFGGIETSLVKQIAYIKQLHQQRLPFSKISQNQVNNLMMIASIRGRKLHGIHAHTSFRGDSVHWFVGWLAGTEDTHYFALRIYHPIDSDKAPPTPEKMEHFLMQIFQTLYIL